LTLQEDLEGSELVRDRIGVTLLWILVVCSVSAIIFITWMFLQPASCDCGG
jgi:hypothetical protein